MNETEALGGVADRMESDAIIVRDAAAHLAAVEAARSECEQASVLLAQDNDDLRRALADALDDAPGAGKLGGNFPADWSTIERMYRVHSEEARLRRSIEEGRRPLISTKPEFMGTTYEALATVQPGLPSAGLDALRQHRRLLMRNGVDGNADVCLGHEPENDKLDPATYRAAQVAFHEVVTRRLACRSVLCLMNTWPEDDEDDPSGYEETNPSNYDPGSEVIDVYAVDIYNVYGLEPGYRWRSFLDLSRLVVDYARERRRPWAVWELGTTPRRPDGVQVPDPWPDATQMWWRDAIETAELLGCDSFAAFQGTGPRGSWTPDKATMQEMSARSYWS